MEAALLRAAISNGASSAIGFRHVLQGVTLLYPAVMNEIRNHGDDPEQLVKAVANIELASPSPAEAGLISGRMASVLRVIRERMRQVVAPFDDERLGNDVHLRWTMATIMTSPPITAAALPKSGVDQFLRHLLPSLHREFSDRAPLRIDPARYGAERPSDQAPFRQPPAKAARYLFEEVAIDGERALLTRHVLLAALRIVGKSDQHRVHFSFRIDLVRKALGYSQSRPAGAPVLTGFTAADSEAMRLVIAGNEASNDQRVVQSDLDLTWACAVLSSARADTRLRETIERLGLSLDRFQNVVRPARARASTVEQMSVSQVESPRDFGSMLVREASIDGISGMAGASARHATVAALLCLPSLASKLIMPESVSRLRSALGYTRVIADGARLVDHPVDADLRHMLVDADSMTQFLWWPGLSDLKLDAAYASFVVERLITDPVVVLGLQRSGVVDTSVVREAMREHGLDAIGVSIK